MVACPGFACNAYVFTVALFNKTGDRTNKYFIYQPGSPDRQKINGYLIMVTAWKRVRY